MEELYYVLAYLTAGVSISMGSVSFYTGLKTQNKADLIFGIMGLCLFAFLLLPPAGFILFDHAPYSAEILVKRLFIFAYYTLFPWFIKFYTGKENNKIPLLISVYVATVYGIMSFAIVKDGWLVWPWAAEFGFGFIALYGIVSGISKYRTEEKAKAKWFILAMGIYGFLFLLMVGNQLTGGFISKTMGMEMFFPIHFHSLLLMLIIGLRLVADVLEKYQLEKMVKARDKRWQTFMHHAPVFVLELDNQGCITYINAYAVEKLGYRDAGEMLNKNWFEMFSLPPNILSTKVLFEKLIREEKMIPYLKDTICTKIGKEIMVDWVNYLSYSDDGQVLGVMSVGRDITDGIGAQRIINQLKLELEKEHIVGEKVTGSTEIIGSSKAIAYAIEKANQVATTSAPVLLEGETGVGKELFADLVHKLSSRNIVPMIKVNCGALPKDLIEDELFGHEKGAFTSAIQSRKGRFELADGGTIFLDEIGELPLEMQPKLLRVLQNGEFERVGGQKTIKVDVRVIAATNRDLAHEVSQNRFRQDLFYRLNVFPITIPSIRKRKEDLPALINYFIVRKSKKYNKALQQISKADMQRLMEYEWPGNVRELKNVIERSVIASTGVTLKLDWFVGETKAEQQSTETLEHIERNHIIKVMEECHWKINGDHGAAETLNMHPNTLRSRMKKLSIKRPLERSSND